METTRREPVAMPIRLLFEVGTVAGMSDGQLLDRFLARRIDAEAAEVAFAALVERHGPMVLRVCRGRLYDEHDAQDAFQATFLILARKAGAIRQHDSAASWLQGVARRVASCARRAAALRRRKEREAAGAKRDLVVEPDRSDVVPAILEEVDDLPERDRAPLMLCLLDGLTHEEAATRLGWPVGTVKTRVRRAKGRLRVALTRRGLAPSLAAIGAALAARTASAMPASLVRATARAALEFEPGRNTAILSASVAKLVDLGLRSLIMTRLKIAALLITSVGVLATGAATGLARQTPNIQEKEKPTEVRPDVKAVEPIKVIAAEVVEEDILDQLETARIDLEVRRTKVDEQKHFLITSIRTGEAYESNIIGVRSAKTLNELKGYSFHANGTFEAAKNRIEAEMVASADQQKERTRQARVTYTEMTRELRRDEQRVKELEERAARVIPDGSKGTAEGDQLSVDDRIDRWKQANIPVDVLRMDVDRWRDQLKAAHRSLQEARDRGRRFARPKAMSEEDYIQAALRLDQDEHLAVGDLNNAQASFLTGSQALVQGERRLRDLAKGLPATFQAEFFPSAAEAKPTPEVDHRLSDVERKLDLILKSLEKQGREVGKK